MIRDYKESDQAEVLNLMRANIPKAFAEKEFQDFKHYLEKEREEYFVFELNREIIGAAGVNYAKDRSYGVLSWHMVHPDHQKNGIGSQLTRFRIDHIFNEAKLPKVIVRTSQSAFEFYQKFGFRIIRTEKDYWSKGYDLVEMELSTV